MGREVGVKGIRLFVVVAIGAALVCAAAAVTAQVLGPCGTPAESTPAAAIAAAPVAGVEPGAPAPAAPVMRMPLPGERAINFELPAVVGDDIKTVKLSDYNGSWRVVCFYPADFTFV